MTRREQQRLDDIVAAIDAIHQHLTKGDLANGLVFDAVRVRLIEIGEAVKALPDALLEHESDIHGPRSPECVIDSHTATSIPHTPFFRPPSTMTCPNCSRP